MSDRSVLTVVNMVNAPLLWSDVRARARELIRCGFLGREELAGVLVDEYEQRGLLFLEAEEILEPVWAARLEEQARWPEVTDLDRLARAFDVLEQQSVVTAMDFTCCTDCGHRSIGEEAGGGGGARGFVYFHQQDTALAAAGGPLLLRFGVFAPGGPTTTMTTAVAEAATAAGHRVVTALTGAGLRAEWDGSPYSEIAVTPIVWQNRLPEH